MIGPQMTPGEAHMETLRLIVGAEALLEDTWQKHARIRELLAEIDVVTDQAQEVAHDGE